MLVFVVHACVDLCMHTSTMVSSGVGTIELVRSENEARILYTPLKKGFILQSKGGHFEKFAATRSISFLAARSLHFKFAYVQAQIIDL